MTRINSSIPPENLIDQHLIAELRELPRVITAVIKRNNKKIPFNDIPEEFILGTGHVKFFYNKAKFLWDRHIYLRLEYFNRFGKDWQFGISYFEQNQDYIPTEKEKQLLIERISTRIQESNQIPRYYGKQITKQKAIEILNQ